MLKGKKEMLSIQLLQVIDAGLIWLAFLVAREFRAPIWSLLGRGQPPKESFSGVPLLLIVVIAMTPIALEMAGFYRHPLRKKAADSLGQMLRAAVGVIVVVAFLVIFLKEPVESRIILGALAPVAAIFLLLREWLVISLVKYAVRSEDAKEAVILAGSPDETAQFREELNPEERASIRVVQEIDLEQLRIDEFEELLKRESVGRVIFLARGTEFGRLARAIERCELQGVEAWVAAGFIQTQIARPDFDVMNGKPMLVLRTTPELSWSLWVKEAIDRVGAFFCILFTLPLWILAVVGIRMTSPRGPVFFRQRRAGRYGKPFTMLKFRTMAPDAEAKLADVKREVGNEMSGPVFKLDRDPRVFGFGRFLRKFSIDELPQLWNVLVGHMSLVGPRPLPLYEVEEFEKSEHRRRLSVKPGITCEWQAGGRNKITSFEDWVRMDLEYIDNWSLWLDLKLLMRTVPAVLFGKGAK